MGIVSERDFGARQVIAWPQKLFGVETLEALIICSADRVAVGQHGVAVPVHVGTQDRGFAHPSGSQQESPASNFRILFLATEPSQERHDAYGALGRAKVVDCEEMSEAFITIPSRTMMSSSVLRILSSPGKCSS